MGKATRWIRGLFGVKKGKENVESKQNNGESEKKRRSFTKPAGKDNPFNEIPANIPATTNTAWLRSYIAASEKENDHHAVAVAAATAAAADAAVKAAQAAEVVVRLTSHGRTALLIGAAEKTSALKIQSMFRGYLARKALRALKCLVKLQALVRGYLVRKRAAATLHSMQALFRAQASARLRRARHSIHEIRSRKSIESFERDILRKRLSASYEPNYYMFEESPKIVEVDTCNGLRPRRTSADNAHEYRLKHNYYHMIPSSPLIITGPNPNRMKIPDEVQDWGFIEEDYKCATAQSTPRFAFAGRGNILPISTAKSVNGDYNLYDCSNCCPNYMTNTQSFKAKSRSYSAPKQRPKPFVSKKRLPLNEIMASRSSFSGVRMNQQRQVVDEVFEC